MSSVVVVARDGELPRESSVWGIRGWVEPEEREALDWLTLCRLLGWDVAVVRPEDVPEALTGATQSFIVGCDPGLLEDGAVEAALARYPLLVITRASGGRAAGGRTLRWTGPGPEREWTCGADVVETVEVDGEAVWASLDGTPIIAADAVRRGIVVTLGFHPSRARDSDGCVTALLVHALTCGVAGPVAWLDFTGTLVLRMDDPGGAQNVHAAGWQYPKLGAAAWAEIRAELRRRDARLSVGYVAGWVDDGDASRGELLVEGRRVDRVAGRVHPSASVLYRDRAGVVHDYAAEFRAIEALRAEGLGDVELHGYTHLHPDRVRWAAAPDRYEAMSWYRELGPAAATAIASVPEEHPLELGVVALEDAFDVAPTTLVPPGHEWTEEVLERALELDLQLVASYYLALRHGDRFCWTRHVCAPYLDEPDAAWFTSGLPVVGYFHDYEPAVYGIGWLERWLDAWQAAGARRLVDFRELAAAVGRRIRMDGVRLSVDRHGAPDLVKDASVFVRLCPLPRSLSASIDGRDEELAVEPLDDGLGRVLLPA